MENGDVQKVREVSKKKGRAKSVLKTMLLGSYAPIYTVLPNMGLFNFLRIGSKHMCTHIIHTN